MDNHLWLFEVRYIGGVELAFASFRNEAFKVGETQRVIEWLSEKLMAAGFSIDYIVVVIEYILANAVPDEPLDDLGMEPDAELQ